MRHLVVRLRLCLAIAYAVFLLPNCARAATPDVTEQVQRLALQVAREQDIREVKTLQRICAQYIEYGLWDEIGLLFTSGAEYIDGGSRVRGSAAIAAYLTQTIGGGHRSRPPGSVLNVMMLEPVVNLSPDGNSAKARWHVVMMLGMLGGGAEWRGGIEENDYVKQNGIWKFARVDYNPIFSGPYESGWRSVKQTVPLLPYHYTSADAGIPVPPLPASIALRTDAASRPSAVSRAAIQVH